MNKKILFLIILIIIVSLSVVSATENQTKDTHNIIQKTSKDSTAMIKTETKNTNKTKVNIKTNNVKGVIGENITLKASVTDEKGKKVSGGNLVFKLNGKSLRTDKKFNSNAKALKIPVKNGTASVTITADAYLRNTKNLTASYSGTSKYEETQSGVTTAQIQKRRANIYVRTEKTISHGENLTIMAKVYDANNNYKNKTAIHENTSVIFKINGRTINNNGKIYYKISQDNIALCNYTIPRSMGSIDKNRQIRNYTITAILVGDNYYPDTKNTTNFTINRNKMKMRIGTEITSNNVINIQGMLYELQPTIEMNPIDYNYYDSHVYSSVYGKNKVCIKINGKTFMDNNGKAKYWEINNGKINITVNIPKNTVIKRIMIVSGERQAYPECKEEINITTEMLYTQLYPSYIYNKNKKMVQICDSYFNGDKTVYESYYDTKNIPLHLSKPYSSIDMSRGTFSFYDEKGFIGNGKIIPFKYLGRTDYLVECPYKFDGKNHDIAVKYSYPNTSILDMQYNLTILSANSLDNVNEPFDIELFYPESRPQAIQERGFYSSNNYLPNYMDTFYLETNFAYNKLDVTIDNKTQTFKDVAKKIDSYGGNFRFNLILPSKYGNHDIKFVFYDKNGRKLLEKRESIVITNMLNASTYSMVENTLFPLNYTYLFHEDYSIDGGKTLNFRFKTIKVTFNNKTTTYKYPVNQDNNNIIITTPSKPGNYTLTYTVYNANNQKMDTNNIILEVYKYTPKFFIKFENNGLELYSNNNSGLKFHQSIFRSGSSFNVSYELDQSENQVHDFDEKFMIRSTFKNIRTNETFVKYTFDGKFEAPKIKGDYRLLVDFIGKGHVNDTNFFNSIVTVI